jgi:membrane protein YqaA with SNARE-associated domain
MLRRLYDWVLHWAETPYGVPALAILAFAESSFFPIPPDVLLIALTLSIPSNGLWYATVCSVFSVLGGMMGYAIGWGLWEVVRGFFLTYVFSETLFNKVGDYYADNAFLYIFTAAFTPIPYKVFTVTAGVWHDRVGLGTLVLASAIGRPLRFFFVAGLIQLFGNPIKPRVCSATGSGLRRHQMVVVRSAVVPPQATASPSRRAFRTISL